MLAIGMIACAQNNQVITKRLQLNNVPNGSVADKHLVIGSDKVVKQVADNSVKTVNGITPINGDVYVPSTEIPTLELVLNKSLEQQFPDQDNAIRIQKNLKIQGYTVNTLLTGNNISLSGDYDNGYANVFISGEDAGKIHLDYQDNNGNLTRSTRINGGYGMTFLNPKGKTSIAMSNSPHSDNSIYYPTSSGTIALSVNNKIANDAGSIILSPITTSFTTNDGKTVSVVNGVIVSVQ